MWLNYWNADVAWGKMLKKFMELQIQVKLQVHDVKEK